MEKQKDLFTKRWRQAKRKEALEHQIQIALVQHLRLRARPGVIYFHVPNGELRDDRAAAKLKAMGVLPGVADLVFVWWEEHPNGLPGLGALRNLYLELKARGRKQQPEQTAFAEAIAAAGARYECVDSIDAALQVLKDYRLLKF